MLKQTGIPLIALAFVFPAQVSDAAESKELREQRQAAQKERQEKKKQRSTEIAEATKTFREFARTLKAEYQEKTKNLDVEFELKRVELEANAKAKVAVAEAEYQKKLTSLFMNPDGQRDDEAILKMQSDGKEYADELFALRKESAEIMQREKMDHEKHKDELLSERDQLALEEAASLGLMKDYEPILASPIGGALTKPEEQWNDNERKEVIRLKERNQYTISEFSYGSALRDWEMKNMEEDFILKWREKAEEHALGAEQSFYNILLMQAAMGGENARQDLMTRMTDLNKEKQLIKIKYKKIKDQNRIKRREEKKKIQGR